jgi:hypothetical protein
LDTTAAITDLDSNIEHSQTEPAPEDSSNPENAVNQNSEPSEGSEEAADRDVAQDAVVELAAEPPRAMRPTRAANDPREVKRREREAALRAQGVSIANSSNSQDTTEGSSSS